MAKSKMVTRRVKLNSTYEVFKVEGTNLVKLGEKTIKGRPSEKELEKEFNVDKVVCVLKSEEKAIFGVPVDDFMAIAVRVDKEENEESEGADNE